MNRNRSRDRNGVWARGAGTAFVGPLDGLAAPILAYSTRRLLAAWQGNCLQLRRSSDDAISDFGFTAPGTLDIDAITTWLGGATGYVTAWYDQTGDGRHLTQATTAKQPTLLTASSVLNNLACFSFDGFDDELGYDAGVGNTIFTPSTCFTAGLYSTPANMGVFARLLSFTVGGNDYDNPSSFCIAANGGGGPINVPHAAGNSGALSRATNAPYVATARFVTGSAYAGVNTTEGTAGTTTNALAPRRMAIGNQAFVGGAALTGKCAESLVYSSDPSDRAAIIAAVKSYGGLA